MFKKNLKIIVIVAVCFILILFSLFYYFSIQQKSSVDLKIYSLEESFIPDKVVSQFKDGYKVGVVNLTLSNLEKEFKLMFEYTIENTQKLENWNKAIFSLNDKAIIQNEGIKNGLFTETTFNPKLVNQAKDYILTKGKKYISGEFISIWFLNVNEPSMGLQTAKDITNEKITRLQTQIISNEITMAQAGDIIRNDASLAIIDKAYESNAYRKFDSIGIDQPIFTDPAIDKAMWNLQVGELSTVLVAKDYNQNGPYEAYYVLIKINDKHDSEYNSVLDLISKRKAEGLEIKI